MEPALGGDDALEVVVAEGAEPGEEELLEGDRFDDPSFGDELAGELVDAGAELELVFRRVREESEVVVANGADAGPSSPRRSLRRAAMASPRSVRKTISFWVLMKAALPASARPTAGGSVRPTPRRRCRPGCGPGARRPLGGDRRALHA